MPIITDPVRLCLVASLARPGGNATGVAMQNDELPGKWLEPVKETLPRASRVAALFQPTYDGGVQLKAAEAAARSLGMRLQVLNVEGPDDFAPAFAARHRLPSIYHQSEFVLESGGLMSDGPDFRDLFRRAATYVDRILKGARPGDLPVQQPTKFELVINRRTAKTLGLTVPAKLLLRADRVIE